MDIKCLGLRFIVVVNTAHGRFLIEKLPQYEDKDITAHDCYGSEHIMEFVWVDGER